MLRLPFYLLLFLWMAACQPEGLYQLTEDDESWRIATINYQLRIQKSGFRFAILDAEGKLKAEAHPVSGLLMGREGEDISPVSATQLLHQSDSVLSLSVETESGLEAEVHLTLFENFFRLAVKPADEGNYQILARTAGISPAFGLADHAAHVNKEDHMAVASSDEITGLDIDYQRDYSGRNGFGGHRMISNFAIFPKAGLAVVNIEAGDKIARFLKDENVQGSSGVREMPALYYFVGNPQKIYAGFLEARRNEGYRFFKPKYEWFGVGWEAYGALAWKTRYETVNENINEYLRRGYPLRWMVVGSGFWPRSVDEFDERGHPRSDQEASEAVKALQATTSFGMWDHDLYPDPKGMIQNFHDKGLKFIIGLRIGFIPGGPFTKEGLQKDYFIKGDDGMPRLFTVGFPKSDVYLLDAHNAAAVDWYVNLCQKWLDYGVDGFKEDLYGYDQGLPDDFLDPINEALMEEGVYVMGRNNYLGSYADIHRYNDFNYNQPQDRGPLNGLAYAYAGLPYVYPDIVGGTGLATTDFDEEKKQRLRIYLMRYAWYAALNPSMSFGYGPWLFDEETNRFALEGAHLHERLLPYIYDAALDTYESGYPYTMTPLPVAFPDDPNVYQLADTIRRSYQWLIGESLLATPLFGSDYATTNSRDIYLPRGKWMEYDSERIFEGPTTLEDYPLPLDKVPLFVGGKGIVIEQKDGVLKARIYPLAENVKMIFTGKDGATSTTIRIGEPDWSNPRISVVSSNEGVSFELVRHAYEFTLVPGQDYVVN